jgi:hypothetical protein
LTTASLFEKDFSIDGRVYSDERSPSSQCNLQTRKHGLIWAHEPDNWTSITLIIKIRTSLSRYAHSMSPEVLQALTTGCLSIFGGSLVVILARRQMLSFRYAAGWLVLLLLTALSGILIPLARPLSESLSTTPGILVSGLAIVILVTICVQLSVSISGLQEQVRKLAEEIALHKVINDEDDRTQGHS